MNEVEELTEADYEGMDPGIRETVRFLRGHGFETTDSGDGRTKFPDGLDEPPVDACALPMANVAIVTEPENLIAEADRLHSLLQSMGIGIATIDSPEDEDTVEIQAGYDPADGSAVIILMFLDDERLARARVFS